MANDIQNSVTPSGKENGAIHDGRGHVVTGSDAMLARALARGEVVVEPGVEDVDALTAAVLGACAKGAYGTK